LASPLPGNSLEQAAHMHVLLLPSSIIGYRLVRVNMVWVSVMGDSCFHYAVSVSLTASHLTSFSQLGMLAERALYFTSSLSLQLVYLRRC